MFIIRLAPREFPTSPFRGKASGCIATSRFIAVSLKILGGVGMPKTAVNQHFHYYRASSANMQEFFVDLSKFFNENAAVCFLFNFTPLFV